MSDVEAVYKDALLAKYACEYKVQAAVNYNHVYPKMPLLKNLNNQRVMAALQLHAHFAVIRPSCHSFQEERL